MTTSETATEEALAFEARQNSVKQLCDLYRVVIAIAVGIAFHNIIDTNVQPIPLKSDYLVTFIALIITIIPFFHGAVRHLFATYVEGGGSKQIRNWAILIDYYLLFIEGGLFVGLASALGTTNSFLILLILVLALDCIWGLLASIGFAGSSSQRAEIKWAVINFITSALLTTLFIFIPALHANGITDEGIQALILVIVIARTAVDYFLNHKFYCP